MGRPGSCGGYLVERCSELGIYPGRYWSDWSSARCCGMLRVLQGRDVHSVSVLVPDSRGLDQNVHDVTIVDMGDVPESSVSLQELSLLRQQWPPAVLRHMVWLQQDLEVMRAEAKQRFRQTRPRSCAYCGTWIKCDMHRQVSLGLGTVVAVPSVLVHSVEGHATGLYGSCSGGTRCSLGC